MKSFSPHQLLKLLGHLNRSIIVTLAHLAAVEKILHLLARVALEHLLELLEPLHETGHWVAAHPHVHLLKQWITHSKPPLSCLPRL